MVTPPPESPLVVRTAVRVGEALGAWRRRRVTAAQDAYIERWKAAWSEGCHAGWEGSSKDAVPYRNGPQRDAWSAGWHWADTHPSPHNPNGTVAHNRHADQARPDVLRAAGGGAIGVAFVAAAQWLWRSRQRSKASASPGHSHSSGRESATSRDSRHSDIREP